MARLRQGLSNLYCQRPQLLHISNKGGEVSNKSKAEIEHDRFIEKTMQEMIDIAPDGSENEEDDELRPGEKLMEWCREFIVRQRNAGRSQQKARVR